MEITDYSKRILYPTRKYISRTLARRNESFSLITTPYDGYINQEMTFFYEEAFMMSIVDKLQETSLISESDGQIEYIDDRGYAITWTYETSMYCPINGVETPSTAVMLDPLVIIKGQNLTRIYFFYDTIGDSLDRGE
jgi:hypothetical protein